MAEAIFLSLLCFISYVYSIGKSNMTSNNQNIVCKFVFFTILVINLNIYNALDNPTQNELFLQMPGIKITKDDEYVATSFNLRELLNKTDVAVVRIKEFSGIFIFRRVRKFLLECYTHINEWLFHVKIPQ